MDDTKPISLEQMRAFVAAGGSAEFQAEDRTEKYACVERTLRHLDYARLSRADSIFSLKEEPEGRGHGGPF
jgi:hypothetical protein